ncbi:hypothetical protein [Pseudomonas sp. NA-150]|uniref:hypothetical protein n=1 Tax=Pseudomonas sp. NA-150 TaxID=3367525 RepID=UPI0037C50ED7
MKWSAQDEDLSGKIEVQGFEAQYAEYLKRHRNPFRFLFFVGWPILGVGFLTMLFGKSAIVVNIFSGSSLFQLIQLHPVLVGNIGLFVLFIAAWLDVSASIGLCPAEYFCEYIDWAPIDEAIPMRAWSIYYLGGSSFYVYWEEEEPETGSGE